MKTLPHFRCHLINLGLNLLFLSLILLPITYAQHTEITKGSFGFMGGDTLNIYFFSDKEEGLILIDQGDNEQQPNYRKSSEAFKEHGCLAGINGGFFTKEFKPLGLIIQNGKQKNPPATGAFTVAGVLYDTGKSLGIMRSKEFIKWHNQNPKATKNAVQGGPFLIEKGKAIHGLDHEKKAPRSFIASDGNGNWCIGISTSLTLKELSEWLTDVKSLNGFRIQSALNLDGGSSTLFWLKQGGLKQAPLKSVRNFLGVKPRNK